MPRSPIEDVVGHWSQLIGNFSTTSVGFYKAVQEALARREVPGLKTSSVVWDEGGVLAPRREYLRIHGDRFVVDLCAAPFGTGYFFSSWVVRKRATQVLFYFVGLV